MDERARRAMARSAAVVALVESVQRRARTLRQRASELREMAEQTVERAQIARAMAPGPDVFDGGEPPTASH